VFLRELPAQALLFWCVWRKLDSHTTTAICRIQYFSVAIFAQIGINDNDALKYQAINNILALIAQACCIVWVDKLGRRRPLIVGNLVNCLMFLIATILISELSFPCPYYLGSRY